MAALLTIRKYAESRKARGLPGGTHPGVLKAVRTGRIALVNGMVDPDSADRAWLQNTSPAHRRTPTAEAMKRKAPSASKDAAAPVPTPDDAETFSASRARAETARANLLELEHGEKAGTLISSAVVRNRVYQKARIACDALMGIPARLAASLAAESDEAKVRIMLTIELRRICAELSAAPGTLNPAAAK